MNYPLFHFDYQKIQHHLETIPPLIEKLNYLYFIKKELGNLIFLLNTTELKEYNFNLQEDGTGLFEDEADLNKYIGDLEELTNIKELPELYKWINGFKKEGKLFIKLVSDDKGFRFKKGSFYGAKIHIQYDLFKEQIKKHLRKLQLCEKAVFNEIEYLNLQKDLDREENSQIPIVSKKIKWCGSETQFVYCIEQLVRAKLLNDDFLDTTGGGFSLMGKYFENNQGKPFKNTQLANTFQNLAANKKTPGKPKGADRIDKVISKTKEKK